MMGYVVGLTWELFCGSQGSQGDPTLIRSELSCVGTNHQPFMLATEESSHGLPRG